MDCSEKPTKRCSKLVAIAKTLDHFHRRCHFPPPVLNVQIYRRIGGEAGAVALATRQSGTFGKPLRSWIQRFIQVRVLGMDIHPRAKIALSASIDRAWPRGVHIGADSLICEEARILTRDLVRGVNLDTRIGARCYVGPRAIILAGLTVGDDAVVMPGTLVTADVPPNSTAVGNPARISVRRDDAASSAGNP